MDLSWDRSLDTRTMMWDAASMLLASPVAQGKTLRPGYVKIARNAARALKREMGEGDVYYGNENSTLVRKGCNQQRCDYLISIDYKLSSSLPCTSIRLLHESAHLAWDGHTVDEELHCRRLEIAYFQNLLRTRWQFKTRSGQQEWSTRVRRGDAVDKSLQLTDMEQFDESHQLVDYVLRAPSYHESIDDAWIRNSQHYWGGLTNRWPETRGLYVRKLAARGGMANARMTKAIVESLTRLGQFRPPPNYASPGYQMSQDGLSSFAILAAGGLGRQAAEGWRVVRKALRPLLVNEQEKAELRRIESDLDPFGDSVRLVGE